MAAKKKKDIDPELFPWDRQPGEGAKAYEAFNKYLLMGEERSYRKVAHELGKSGALISGWCSKYKWVERVAAWDEEQLRLDRKEQQEAIARMRKRHAALATQMLTTATLGLQNLMNEIKSKGACLTANDISRLTEVASKLERISRGDSGEVVEERDGGKAPDPVSIYIPDNGRGVDDDESEE